MKYYVVDAFAEQVFEGNPAAVMVLGTWPEDSLMLQIAKENNLSETAFAVRDASGEADYQLRWFTPAAEIDLCGHATLATAFVIDTEISPIQGSLRFATLSGILEVKKVSGLYEMDFPSRMPARVEVTGAMEAALGARPLEAYLARDLLLMMESDEQIRQLTPDFSKLEELDGLLCVVMAKGADCDFVSRAFAPKMGVQEDPVCGSAHCSLIPFWAERLGKTVMTAKQRSPRKGTLHCEYAGERVRIAGSAVLYAKGECNIPSELMSTQE